MSVRAFFYRENILKTAKALVEDTKMLVSGAASGQDKLSQAAQSSAKTITQLTDVVKLGAASIGSDDPETQVGLLPPPHPLFFSVLSVANHTSVIATCDLSGGSSTRPGALLIIRCPFIFFFFSPGGSDKCRERCGESSG